MDTPPTGAQPLRQQQHTRRRLVAPAASLLLWTTIALAAPLLAPDPTAQANRQVPNAAALPPGTALYHVLLPPLTEGTAAPRAIAITQYRLSPDSLHYQVFRGRLPNGTLVPGEWQRVAYSQLAGSNQSFVSPLHLQEAALQRGLIWRRYWLGTDLLGRDLLSRLLWGTRISLGVGAAAVCIALSLGTLIGLLAGLGGRYTDAFVQGLINTVWTVPTLLLAFLVAFILGKGIAAIFIAIGLTMWVETARMVRGQVLSLRQRPFVEAAFALGMSRPRLLLRHVLPHILSPLYVIAAADFASAILLEAGLSFLGIGINPPTPSWGNLLAETKGFLTAATSQALLPLVPCLAIGWLVLACYQLGNGLRDLNAVQNTPSRLR